MCTATWLDLDRSVHGSGTGTADEARYALYFNRDESRLRGRAAPPAVLRRSDDLTILAPRDADAGGTWIAVNTAGLTVCLLNRYQDAERIVPSPDRRRSRGLLVLDLATARSAPEVAAALAAQELDRYPAFTVLAAAPGSRPVAHHWTGRELQAPHVPAWPVSSSGHDAAAAARARQELWREISSGPGGVEGGRPDEALALHRSHRPRRGALSPCMHRAVAGTVSLTVVRVEPDRVGMAYADGPPCSAPLGDTLWIPR